MSRRLLPVLLLLFVGSGCAALIYEIVWFQLLQLVIGSSAVSLGVLLGTFMGGIWARGNSAAWRGSRRVPRAADALDGRNAAGDRAVGRDDAGGRVVAGVL